MDVRLDTSTCSVDPGRGYTVCTLASVWEPIDKAGWKLCRFSVVFASHT